MSDLPVQRWPRGRVPALAAPAAHLATTSSVCEAVAIPPGLAIARNDLSDTRQQLSRFPR